MSVLSLSGDGRWAASYSHESGFVSVWNVEDRLEDIHYRDYVLHGEVSSLALSPAGGRLALGDMQGHVRLVDMGQGNTRTRLHTGFPFPIPGRKVTALTWSKDESKLAAAFGQHAMVWNLPKVTDQLENSRLRPVELTAAGETRIVTDNTGSQISVGNQLTCTIFDGAEWSRPNHGEMQCHVPLKFSHGSSNLWGLDRDGKLMIERTDPCILQIGGYRQATVVDWLGSAFTNRTEGFPLGSASPDGRRLVICRGSWVAIWMVDGDEAHRIAETSHPSGADFTFEAISSDSGHCVILAKDGSVVHMDLTSGELRLLRQFREKAVTACFRPNSTECYFGTSSGQLLRLDTTTDDPPEVLDASFGLPAHMIATPDGERLLTAGPGEQLGIRRLPDGAPIVQLTHHGLALEPGRHNLKRLLYLPKQQRVVSLSEDGWLTQW
jgi:WD40 repeat protein